MSTTDTLIAARKLIDTPEKWCKGAFRLETPARHCADGALIMACWDKNILAPNYTLAERALRDAVRASSIRLWNDAPERTHAEVLAAFDKAIAATAPRQPEEA